MRNEYADWLLAQGYAANTIVAQVHRVQRVEEYYGPLDEIVARSEFPALFEELSYSTEDERRAKPNPSRIPFDGNARNNLASYKNAAARYAQFLRESAGDAQSAPFRSALVGTTSNLAALPENPVAEGQRLSLERDMQMALRSDIFALEPGLVIIDDGTERAVLSGFIDILCRDAQARLVVVELKAGKTDARVIGQTLGYMGDIGEEESERVRGIIVAHEFDQRTRSAARAVSDLQLVRYKVSFTFTSDCPQP